MSWSIYHPSGTHEGSTVTLESAIAVVGMLGPGSTIRMGQNAIVWCEGVDGVAQDDIERTGNVISDRIHGFAHAPSPQHHHITGG